MNRVSQQSHTPRPTAGVALLQTCGWRGRLPTGVVERAGVGSLAQAGSNRPLVHPPGHSQTHSHCPRRHCCCSRTCLRLMWGSARGCRIEGAAVCGATTSAAPCARWCRRCCRWRRQMAQGTQASPETRTACCLQRRGVCQRLAASCWSRWVSCDPPCCRQPPADC